MGILYASPMKMTGAYMLYYETESCLLIVKQKDTASNDTCMLCVGLFEYVWQALHVPNVCLWNTCFTKSARLWRDNFWANRLEILHTCFGSFAVSGKLCNDVLLVDKSLTWLSKAYASSPAKVSSYLPFDKPFASRPSKFIITAD